jgi:predicted  nucleic acid-binding Zn-ribbon protein
LNPDLKTLIELQQLDLRIQELSTQIERLPAEILNFEKELSAFIHAHEDRQHRLAANQKERRDLEAEVQMVRGKISKHKGQLYEVKTNEQYRAMLKEIEGEEGNIRRIEDQVLEKMIEAEDLQKRVAEAEAKLEGEKARVAQEKKRLEAMQRADTEERDRLAAERREMAATLPEPTLILYERVRRGRGGVAVAVVRDGLCTACNVVLRPQLYNEVRTNEELHECENCARILYAAEAAPAESESSGQPAVAQG